MKTIKLTLGEKSYNIFIGGGLLRECGQRLKETGFTGKVVVVTDTEVKYLYGRTVRNSLEECGFEITTISVPPGEGQKTLETAGKLYLELSNSGTERGTPVIALGGGVIGDLAGFVAATFKRGVPFVQMPTTLLAQIDSSVGGKVAVDHGQLKNEIGAFYQPRLVLSDLETLRTLPGRELSAGLAEVIKHAAIMDADFFAFLEKNMEGIMALELDVLEEAVYRSVKIKASVVEKDEKDTGLRNVLNYGHTVGHALESASDFGLRHGEAVGLGMIAAAEISRRMGLLDTGDVDRLRQLIKQADLPVNFPALGTGKLLDFMKHDKKVAASRVKFVLLKSIGEALVTDNVNMDVVREVLDELAGGA